jgi:hypothetical protein
MVIVIRKKRKMKKPITLNEVLSLSADYPDERVREQAEQGVKWTEWEEWTDGWSNQEFMRRKKNWNVVKLKIGRKISE